jgi:hypothetical protein
VATSSKNTRKKNLLPILNKNSSQSHTKLELDMLGVDGKLVKWFTCLKRIEEKKKKSSHMVSKEQMTNFWSIGILGVKVDGSI